MENKGIKLWHLLALPLLAGIFILPKNSPTILWVPSNLEVSVFQGGARSVELQFKSAVDISNVKVYVVPEIKPFVSTNPSEFVKISAGTENDLTMLISIPKTTPLGTLEGTTNKIWE